MKAGDHPFDYVPFRPVQRLGKKQMQSQAQAVDEQAVEQGLDKAQSLSDVHVTLLPPAHHGHQEATNDQEEHQAKLNFSIMERFWKTRQDFGLARIQMGALLCLIKDHKLWRGYAETWDAFLGKENVNTHAARQYMGVAKKFVFEMDLPSDVLAKMSLAGMTALEKAATTMTEANQHEIVAVLSTLAERDAVQRLIELSCEDEEPTKNKPSLRVLRILKEFSELPPDMQQEVRDKIAAGDRRRSLAKEADEREIAEGR